MWTLFVAIVAYFNPPSPQDRSDIPRDEVIWVSRSRLRCLEPKLAKRRPCCRASPWNVGVAQPEIVQENRVFVPYKFQKGDKEKPLESAESKASNNWNVLTIERQAEVCSRIRLKRRLSREKSSKTSTPRPKRTCPRPKLRGVYVSQPSRRHNTRNPPKKDAQHSSGVPTPRTRPTMRRLAPVRNHRLLYVQRLDDIPPGVHVQGEDALPLHTTPGALRRIVVDGS